MVPVAAAQAMERERTAVPVAHPVILLVDREELTEALKAAAVVVRPLL